MRDFVIAQYDESSLIVPRHDAIRIYTDTIVDRIAKNDCRDSPRAKARVAIVLDDSAFNLAGLTTMHRAKCMSDD